MRRALLRNLAAEFPRNHATLPFPYKILESYGVYTAPLKCATQKLDGYGGQTIDRTHLTFDLDFCVPWRKRRALSEEI